MSKSETSITAGRIVFANSDDVIETTGFEEIAVDRLLQAYSILLSLAHRLLPANYTYRVKLFAGSVILKISFFKLEIKKKNTNKE